MKRILGLDLGTNSIGWSLIEINHKNNTVKILGLGTRVIPMNGSEKSIFENGGNLVSAASKKTTDKRSRRTKERFLLRRDRLHCVLNLLNALPDHYKINVDFERNGKRSGQFKKETEPKIAYFKDENGKYQFYFMDAYIEMEKEFRKKHPELPKTNKKGGKFRLPFDWTLYYLRKKALKDEITLEELSWVLLSYNQKRGYEKVRGLNEEVENQNEKFLKTVNSVECIDNGIYKIELKNNTTSQIDFTYYEETNSQLTSEGDIKEVEKISDKDEYTIRDILNLHVKEVSFIEVQKGGKRKYKIVYENDWVQEKSSKYKPKWEGSIKEIITKVSYDKNGKEIKTRDGKSKRSFDVPTEDDWTLQKLKTDSAIKSYITKHKNTGVSSYIYSELLKNPQIKLKGAGGLVTVIDRDIYRDELEKIIETQQMYHPNELANPELFKKAIYLLYPNNENLKKGFPKDEKAGMKHLLADDILLYQRDLKSKKSEIANCRYEWKREINVFNKVTQRNEKKKVYLKAIHKSNPYYQEFRVWDLIKRVKILKINDKNDKGELIKNVDVSNNKVKDKEALFEFLNEKEAVTEYELLNFLSLDEKLYKWNLTKRDVSNELKANKKDQKACNETRANFVKRLKKVKGLDVNSFLSKDIELKIWHFIYSVKKQSEFKKGLLTLFQKIGKEKNLSEYTQLEIVKNFETFPSFQNDYATYSEKAIKKLLPFMRVGKYWNQEFLDDKAKNRIKDIVERLESIKYEKEKLNKVSDDAIPKQHLKSFLITRDENPYKGLSIYQACYAVYGFFSEVGDVQYWSSPIDIKSFIKNEFKQHSLKSPIVEKVIVETLQLVKAIWEDKEYGNNESNYFHEIHLELAREMKKNNTQKKADSDRNLDNRKTNERIKLLLQELQKVNNHIEPFSTSHQDRLKIIEDGILSGIKFHKEDTTYAIKDSKFKISKKEIFRIHKDIYEDKIKQSDIERYKIWLDQRYQSPYTGKMIKLSDLFNREKYEIEHVLPKERINLDAFYNKVICETEVNTLKGAKTGYEFILDANKQSVYCSAHQSEVSILPEDEYLANVKSNYQGAKQLILSSKDIPNKFTNSQLNNTRYISKAIMGILSNIVRKDDVEKGVIDNGFKSINLIPVNGRITSILKKDWRLNDTWNRLLEPRFKRLNKITNTNLFGYEDNKNGHTFFRNTVPEEFEQVFNKKRIDHRNHALDALVVALTTINHTNYLNNQFSKDKKSSERFELRNQLTFKRRIDKNNSSRIFYQPLQSKKNDSSVTYEYLDNQSNLLEEVVFNALRNIVISYKTNKRIINKSSNKTEQWVEEDGKMIKKLVPQQAGKRKNIKKWYNWDIRKRLNEDTFSGVVKLKQETEYVNIEKALNELKLIFDPKIKDFLTRSKENNATITEIEKELGTKKVKVYKPYVAVRPKERISTKIKIEDITDLSIQRILNNHLNQKKYQNQLDADGKRIPAKELAFSPEGLIEMNENIKELNGGKDHKPIFKARLKKAKGKRFPQGETGNKKSKYVVTAGSSNNYLGVYFNSETKERIYLVPSLKETIEGLKQKNNNTFLPEKAFDKKNNEYQYHFELSPNELVYVPTDEELHNPSLVKIPLNAKQKNRVYVVNDFNRDEDKNTDVVNFVQNHISEPIYGIKKIDFDKNKIEKKLFHNSKNFLNEIALTNQNNMKQTTIELDIEEGILIKDRCWKLEVDRLGNIKKIIK